MKIAKEVTAGDSIKWTESVQDYPASDGWTLKYALVNGSSKIDITSTADVADHAFTVASSETADWSPGRYRFQAYVESGAERHTVGSGTVDVLPDFVGVSTHDGRTHAERTLAAIEAVIEKRATKDQESYTIKGRSLSRTPLPDLLVLRDRYRSEVRAEKRAEKVRSGQRPGNKIHVRFK